MATAWLKGFWNHPAGPKTVFFWAPTFKWTLGLANIADYNRPPDKVSYPQQSAAALTGVVFMKYSLDVIPKNYNLFSVNAFLAATAAYQLSRKIHKDYIAGPTPPATVPDAEPSPTPAKA
eukprot:TRINITY_DN7145_c0_g1_i1.p2 TRINITY_DN7145_c0_g1~~TRINITY_DN7145_c0_g1_i1.p2  ORF type:complete len:120 (-),score=20.01 TRINITY_DN7145_c0_g1_i1:603-962(-)